MKEPASSQQWLIMWYADESDQLVRTKYLDGCRNEGKLGYLEAFYIHIAVRWFTAEFIWNVINM